MKKLLTTSTLALVLSLSSAAFAQFQGGQTSAVAHGGFNGPSSAVTTVAQALNSKDDTLVILTGKIEKEIGKEKYLFKDNTGTITLDIDKDEWRGTIVTPTDLVEIQGEVDKDLIGEVEIDVNRVTKKQ